jgi:hypothetical protein
MGRSGSVVGVPLLFDTYQIWHRSIQQEEPLPVIETSLQYDRIAKINYEGWGLIPSVLCSLTVPKRSIVNVRHFVNTSQSIDPVAAQNHS